MPYIIIWHSFAFIREMEKKNSLFFFKFFPRIPLFAAILNSIFHGNVSTDHLLNREFAKTCVELHKDVIHGNRE